MARSDDAFQAQLAGSFESLLEVPFKVTHVLNPAGTGPFLKLLVPF